MKSILLIIPVFFLSLTGNGQKYITRNGYIGFYSHAPVEDIKADNNQVASVLDSSTGDIVFQVLIRAFHFQKALMEEHFNENYMESDKYPKSTFTGKITNISSVDFTKPGMYNVSVDGELNIHNVAHKISVPGTIEVASSGIIASAKFNLTPEDYNITIPSIVRNNIAKIIEVSVNMNYSSGQSQ